MNEVRLVHLNNYVNNDNAVLYSVVLSVLRTVKIHENKVVSLEASKDARARWLTYVLGSLPLTKARYTVEYQEKLSNVTRPAF